MIEALTTTKNAVRFIERTRDDPDFYQVMGPLFGSRLVVKELGMPMYDDPDRIWCIAIAADGRAVACSSIAFDGKKAQFKSAWVHPDYRRQHIYDELFRMRLALAEAQHVTTITATATQLSRNTHLRHSFRQIGTRGKYFLMRKDLTNER